MILTGFILLLAVIGIILGVEKLEQLDNEKGSIQLDNPKRYVTLNEREYQLEQFMSMTPARELFFLPDRDGHDYRPPDPYRNAVMLNRGDWCLTGPWWQERDEFSHYPTVRWTRYFIRNPHPEDIPELAKVLQHRKQSYHRIRIRTWEPPTFLPYEGMVPA